MAAVTRTLKKGGETGKLDRAEVRAVTAAIAEGRTDDVLSGAVLKQFRAARRKESGVDYGVLVTDVDVQREVTKTADARRSAGTGSGTGRKGGSIAKRGDGGRVVTFSSPTGGAAAEKGKAPSRSKK